MNSKLIAIIAVVAMCGAALVGVGYAYSATFTPGETTITTGDANYITISPKNPAASSTASWTGINTIEYNTLTSNDGTITYTPVGADSGTHSYTETVRVTYIIDIDFTKSGIGAGKTVSVEVTGSQPKIYENSEQTENTSSGNVSFGTIKIGNVDGCTKDNTDDNIVKVTVPVATEGGEQKATITVVLYCDISYGQVTYPSIPTTKVVAKSTFTFSIDSSSVPNVV